MRSWSREVAGERKGRDGLGLERDRVSRQEFREGKHQLGLGWVSGRQENAECGYTHRMREVNGFSFFHGWES